MSKQTAPNIKPGIKLEAYADRLWESVETHQLNDAAVAALTDLVVDCSSTGIILRANAAFCEFAGLPAEEIEGRDGHEFAFLQNRDAPRCTLEITSPRGERTWFDRLQLAMRDPENGNHFIRVVGRDVTEHKLSEIALKQALKRAEEADAAKSRFLAIVSHEIRTPLNGIIGMGKLMSDTILSAEQHNYIEAITTSSEALLLLVNDLLQFGRNELNQDKLIIEPADLRALIAGVVELMAEKAHDKGLDLGYIITDKVPSKIAVDAGRLRQILFNIIGNAVKFTESGGIRLDVDFFGDDRLIIKATDTGEGISAEDQEKIFEPFEQVEQISTRRHDGAGLGLAIAQRMAHAMGGDISVASEIGTGSIFKIELKAQILEKYARPTLERSGGTILLALHPGIEADILHEFVGQYFDKVVRVGTFDDAKGALEKGDTYERAIIDSRLGDIASLLEEKSRLRATPLIALITPDERGSVGAQFQANDEAFLTRPLRQSTCLRVIEATTTQQSEPVIVRRDAAISQSNSKRVLLAEDNAINALLATKLLERSGYIVKHVENGLAAIKAIEAERFDLVLMDFHMPVMDGIAAIKSIRKKEEEHGECLPIFMVTADSSDDVMAQVLDAGATGILQKPLCIEALERALAGLDDKAA